MPNILMTCDLCGKSHNYTKTHTYFIKFPGQHQVRILRECDYCQHGTTPSVGGVMVSSRVHIVYLVMIFSFLVFLANSLI